MWQRRLDGARDTLQNVLLWNNSHQQGGASLRILVALNRFWNGTAKLLSTTDPRQQTPFFVICGASITTPPQRPENYHQIRSPF